MQHPLSAQLIPISQFVSQHDMERWAGKTAVVTGASAGIGRAIAAALAENGLVVVAVARREDKLKELAASLKCSTGGRVVPFAADVTNANDVVRIIEEADSLGGVSVIVNNAGVAYNTRVLDSEMDKWRKMFELNVFAAGALMGEAIRSMKRTNIDGHIVNISSISAHGVPLDLGKHIYNSTKHALRLVTEGFRAELTNEKSKIKLTMVSPGLVKTEIFDVGNWDGIKSVIDEVPILSPEDVAHACVQVLSTPPNVMCTEYIIRPVGETIPA